MPIKRIILIVFLSIHSYPFCMYSQKLNEIEFDSIKIFNFKKLYHLYYSDFEGEPIDTVRADLIVNSDSTRDIGLVRANIKGDTLTILIHQTDPAYHHEYLITIIKKMYFIKYRFLTSGDSENEGDVFPLETKLKLNTRNLRKGIEISGYTEFKGRCIFNCYEDLISVKGNFSAIIR